MGFWGCQQSGPSVFVLREVVNDKFRMPGAEKFPKSLCCLLRMPLSGTHCTAASTLSRDQPLLRLFHDVRSVRDSLGSCEDGQKNSFLVKLCGHSLVPAAPFGQCPICLPLLYLG